MLLCLWIIVWAAFGLQWDGMISSDLSRVAADAIALSGCCRSFIGGEPALKIVISKDEERSQLVGSAESFLHAVDGDPTACTLLLEAIELQVIMTRGFCVISPLASMVGPFSTLWAIPACRAALLGLAPHGWLHWQAY